MGTFALHSEDSTRLIGTSCSRPAQLLMNEHNRYADVD